MSIEAKVLFMSNLERKAGDVVSANALRELMSTVSELLDGYQMEKTDGAEDQQDDLLETYIDTMRVQGRSEKTIDRYTYIIRRMMGHVKVTTQQITVYHLRKYLADEKARGISDRTLDGERQIFGAYFNWLQREGLITKNPTINLGAIKCAKKEKKAYSEAEVDRLRFATKRIRDRAIIDFLSSTGCRVSEMVGLNRDDVDLNRLECTVLGKGNKERTVYLSEVAGMTLQAYLDSRKDNEEALFIGKRNERLLPGGVRYILKSLANKTGVEHAHPHKFRRTLATNLIKHGMAIQEVATILGHDKLDTTMQYVVIDKTSIRNAFRKYA